MSESVHQTVVVAECMFLPHAAEAKRNDNGPKILQIVLAAVEDTLKVSKSNEKHQQSVILSTASKEKQVPCEFDLVPGISKICEQNNVKMQVLQGLATLEETLLVAKKSIDELNSSDIIIIVPKSEVESCKRIAQLIFNGMAYSFKTTPVALEVDAAQIKSKSDEEISNEVCKILSTLEPSDGQSIKLIKSPLICGDFFYHGYTTRTGGVSTFSTMRSLSLVFSPRKKDTRIYVEENRKRLAKTAGFKYTDLKMAKAVHGIDVWVIGDEPPDTFDAMVTDKPGITIAAPGADCQTLLFCDPEKKVVGAAHSGWKGTVDRVQQNVVKVMVERFHCNPKDILVSIGPSIASCCYNVYEERAQQFITGVAQSTVVRKDGVPYLDLWNATVILLEEVGIRRQNIDDGKRFSDAELNGQEKVTQCTYCNPEKFFSYRRDGAIFGNQIGFIGIKKFY